MKKVEFSKLIFWLVFTLTVFISGFAMAMVIVLEDSSILSYLIPSIFAEFATGTAFYYNKAKLENKIKLLKSYNIDLSSEDFNNADC